MASEPRRSNRKLMTSENRKCWVEWDEETCLELIELYRDKPVLWDPEDPNYSHRLPKIEAWKDISSHFLCRMDEVKLKMMSLRKKLMDELCREASTTDTYESDWFAYDSFHFLRDITRNRRRVPYDSDCNEISEDPLGSNTNAVNTNSTRNGHMSEYFEKPRNQLSSSEKPTRRRTATPKKCSPSDKKNIQNKTVSALVHGECSTFADHVKIKLEKFGLHERAILMHKINNLIFDAEMKKYGVRNNFESQFENSVNDSDVEFVDPSSGRVEYILSD